MIMNDFDRLFNAINYYPNYNSGKIIDRYQIYMTAKLWPNGKRKRVNRRRLGVLMIKK